MNLAGIEGMDIQQISKEVQRGAKFVVYQYCLSIIFMTFMRSSNIYFIRAGESAVGKGLGFSFISLLLGWWGIPWGPIHTIGSFITNFSGGKDVTQVVLDGFKKQGT